MTHRIGFAEFVQNELREKQEHDASMAAAREDIRKKRARLWEDEPGYVTARLALAAARQIRGSQWETVATDRRAEHGDFRRANREATETINTEPYRVDSSELFDAIRALAHDCEGLEAVTEASDDDLAGYLAQAGITPDEDGKFKPYDSAKPKSLHGVLSEPWRLADGFLNEYVPLCEYVRLPD